MSIQEDYTEKSNEELLQMYGSTHSLEIKQELVMRYLYVVKSIALQMRDVYISFSQMEDIVNEGVLVIMNAIEKFDAKKQVKFRKKRPPALHPAPKNSTIYNICVL